jgi:hypothetical protein
VTDTADTPEFDLTVFDLDFSRVRGALETEWCVLLDPGRDQPPLAVTTPARMGVAAGLRRLCSLVLFDLVEHGDAKTAGRIARDALPWADVTDDDDVVEHLGRIAEGLADLERPGKSDTAFLMLDMWRRKAEAEAATVGHSPTFPDTPKQPHGPDGNCPEWCPTLSDIV